jgi:hypothetical protein
MGVPTSEVGYTLTTTGRGNHEVHKGHVVALAQKTPLQNKNSPGKTTRPYNNGQNCLLPTLHHLDINTPTCTAGYKLFGAKGLGTLLYGYFFLKIEIV